MDGLSSKTADWQLLRTDLKTTCRKHFIERVFAVWHKLHSSQMNNSEKIKTRVEEQPRHEWLFETLVSNSWQEKKRIISTLIWKVPHHHRLVVIFPSSSTLYPKRYGFFFSSPCCFLVPTIYRWLSPSIPSHSSLLPSFLSLHPTLVTSSRFSHPDFSYTSRCAWGATRGRGWLIKV